MENLFISLAYKYVALALMIAEANHAIEKLDVAGWKLISMAEVVSYHISPPRLRPGGSLDTRKYMFGFGGEGRLQFIHAYQPEHQLSIEERHRRWAKMKSLIGTKETYQLATNWLTGLEVDVAALETAHPSHVTQEFYYEGGVSSPERVVMPPRFEVKWGTNLAAPAVWVSIFGPTKEPLQIRQNDISFSKRPRALVKDAERLLTIPDAEFGKYTLLQKSNLVVESAVVPYPSFSLPDVVRAKPKNTLSTNANRDVPGAKGSKRLPQREVHTLPPSSEPKSREPE
jgi:hypothetical protein